MAHFLDMAKEGASPWGRVWHYPLLDKELVDVCGFKLLNAILLFNKKFLNEQSWSFYTGRGQLIDSFADALPDETHS